MSLQTLSLTALQILSLYMLTPDLHHLHFLHRQAMDVVDGRRPPFPPHRYSNSGDTRDTDTQAPSSGDSSPSPRPCSSDHLQSPDGSPCSAEDTDKGETSVFSIIKCELILHGKLCLQPLKFYSISENCMNPLVAPLGAQSLGVEGVGLK